jgi:hypothetical protein
MDKATKRAAASKAAPTDTLGTDSQPYVGRWNRLVSTTNWEKGRIICEWRETLEQAGAPPREYSDEAWSRLVGCVTAQHVGRLRRVYQRFGQVQPTYEGLYWSHFHAAIEWDDAEMYLEGAVQNGWSVSQMRRTRWEAMGAVEKDRPRDADAVAAELDEDFEAGESAPPEKLSTSYGEVSDPGKADAAGSRDKKASQDKKRSKDDRVDEVAAHADGPATAPAAPVRPFEELGELPEDVADAFEQMKLAILRHKADGWSEITRDEMLAALDSLKELALAPSADGTPF